MKTKTKMRTCLKGMVKRAGLLLLMGMSYQACEGQTLTEWFSQKKTRKKYLLEQIAALRIYAGYVQKGYAIASDGLRVIGAIKQDGFRLHRNFFNSLEDVNPNLQPRERIAEVTALQQRILDDYNRIDREARQSGAFKPAEVAYIHRVYGRLLDGCASTLDELRTVATAGKLQMADGERLARMDQLARVMVARYGFSRRFARQTLLLATARLKEKNDLQTMGTLYGTEGN